MGMVRLLDDPTTVDDDELVVECRGCDTVWVFEHGSEAAYEFKPDQDEHPSHEAEVPVPAERYLRGREWIIDHESSVKRLACNSQSIAESQIASFEMFPWCFFENDHEDPEVRSVEPGLPPIGGYYLREDTIDGEERDRIGKKIACAVIDLSPREVGHVELMATPGLGNDDPEAFEQLAQEIGIEFESHGLRGTWLEATVEASETIIDAVIRLFAGRLLTATFYDHEGRKIFARHDGSRMSFYLEAELFDDLTERLSPDEVDRIERSGWG
jgi:hypothetical protein